MTYAELYELVKEYTHRNDLTEPLLDQMLNLTSVRLGRDLKSVTNEFKSTLTFTDNIAPLPDDCREVRYLKDGDKYPDYVTATQNIYGDCYSIVDGNINYKATVADLIYWGVPPVADTTCLDRHPSLYLYAMISEVARFLNDADMIDGAEFQYTTELKLTNKSESQARTGNNPVMR